MMKASIIILALISKIIDGSPTLKECRIIGGTTVAEEEIPWMVSVQSSSDHFCGASIISPDWIVSSGYCLQTTISGYKVRAGSLFSKSGGTLHTVVEKVMQTDNNDPYRDVNSISLIRVNPPFTYGIMTGPVALPDSGTFAAPGTLMTVAGWGKTSSSGTYSDWLLKIEEPMIPSWQCDMLYSGVGGISGITPDQMCAGNLEGGQGVCLGDVGGPMILDGVLYGIAQTSYNICGDVDSPGIYTNVSMYRSWINQVTGI